ncbi:hypothetical protein CYMTET_49931 [Cymbomonas tetramitiformis]|uniref:Uncharacterized protein n=1 Tax=Cymbomonas tetramitiformis TaxID=36881 RepID=A0AAE0BPB4_9CHLO|nr:hypothetical protein CYMTET_49931 [Cymbomonas tetramitiformis]|eukprot:gene6946-8287_t
MDACTANLAQPTDEANMIRQEDASKREEPTWLRMLVHIHNVHVNNAAAIKRIAMTVSKIEHCPPHVVAQLKTVVLPVHQGGLYRSNNGSRLKGSLLGIAERHWQNGVGLKPLDVDHAAFESYTAKCYTKKMIEMPSDDESKKMSWDQWLAFAYSLRANVASRILTAMRHAQRACSDRAISKEILDVITGASMTASNGSSLRAGIKSILQKHAPKALSDKREAPCKSVALVQHAREARSTKQRTSPKGKKRMVEDSETETSSDEDLDEPETSAGEESSDDDSE